MKIVTSHPIIDSVLDRHGLGADLPRYRNHVYRGLNYQRLMLGGDSIPDTAALAWAVHDLGIWTAKTFDYLEPSAALIPGLAAEFGITDIESAQRMTLEHHRLRPNSGQLIETFRKADLVDASRGLLRGRVSRSAIRSIVAELPYHGFHSFLVRGLTGYAVRHPTRPAPMLRW